MNAVLSLCHFCENHGPSVLFCTQTFHTEEIEDENSFFGPVKPLDDYPKAQRQSNIPCEACVSVVTGYVTNDYKNKIKFISCQLPLDDNLSKLVKQAAVRSLSCEVVPGKQGQIYFGDDVRGHVLSYTFSLQDCQARGFHRWYSIVVFMRDKHFLLNSWLFFQKHIGQLVDELQKSAAKVYDNEEKECPQRALRLNEGAQMAGVNKVARPLTELTGLSDLYSKVHLWFTWMLSTGAVRLEEHVPLRSMAAHNVKLGNQGDGCGDSITMYHLRHLFSILGEIKSKSLLYGLLTGRQLVIRGPKPLVCFVIKLVKVLLPPKKLKCIDFIDSYKSCVEANVIGLELCAAVPVASLLVERLDIVPINPRDWDFGDIVGLGVPYFQYLAKSGAQLPAKLPTLVSTIYCHLADEELSDQLAYLLVSGLVDKWTHTADVVREAKLKCDGQDLSPLLLSLGANEFDQPILQFWAS